MTALRALAGTAAVALTVTLAPPGPSAAAPGGSNTVHDLVVGSTFVVGAATLYAPNGGLRIRSGDTVVWTNLDPVSHDVTFEALSYSGYMRTPGASVQLTFSEAGYFRYYCSQHPELPGMYGLVYVSDSAPY